MEKVANLFSIKVLPLLIGVGLVIIIVSAIFIYMKKKKFRVTLICYAIVIYDEVLNVNFNNIKLFRRSQNENN